MTVPGKESINPKSSYDTHDNSGVAAEIWCENLSTEKLLVIHSAKAGLYARRKP